MQKLTKLLENGSSKDLEKLVHRAQNMARLSQAVQAALSPELAAQVTSVNLRKDGSVAVVCRSSAAAARLRYEEETILAAVGSTGVEAGRVKVKVGR